MDASQAGQLLPQVPGWEVLDGRKLHRAYRFADFASALAYVNQVGAVAEEQGHHPDLCLSWGKVEATVWTHKIDGLTESDFIFAAKMDALAKGAPGIKD
jgi:4a-hydroxytetrahydrobiopterin dehydratase